MSTFQDFKLSDALQKAITEMGYTTPSPIQQQALPLLLGEKTDFLGLAATGTGKTAAFSIPLLEQIDPSLNAIQALILCPTRELALQVAGQIELLGRHIPVHTAAVYGGSSYVDQFRALKKASVVIGTPGRVIDHIEKGSLVLSNIKTLILDEADEMISMGFKDDLETILSSVPREESNTWLFSATMSREVRKVADTYLRSPKQVQVNKTEMVPTTIEQLFYRTKESNKPEILCKIIDAAEDFYGIVFCQTKIMVTDLTRYMTERGYQVDCLHGDKDQNARERSMKAFREHKVKILVCTDVASRGLDVKDVTHVVNYSLPRELDNYVHRIGRTARSGKKGVAMSLVTPSHHRLLGQIERMTKTVIKEGRVPSRKEVGIKKVAKVLPHFQEQPTFTRAVELFDDSWKTAIAGMDAAEVAGRFLTLMFPEIFAENFEQEMTRTEREPRNDSRDRDGGGYRGRNDRRDSRGGSGGGYGRASRDGGGEDRRDFRASSSGSSERREYRGSSDRSDSRPPRREYAPRRTEGGFEEPRREFRKPRPSSSSSEDSFARADAPPRREYAPRREAGSFERPRAAAGRRDDFSERRERGGDRPPAKSLAQSFRDQRSTVRRPRPNKDF